MTEDQHALLDQLVAALSADPRIRSAWLSGSLAKGAGDAWSDIDLTVVVDEPDLAACLRDCAAGALALPATVFSQLVHGRIFSGVTPAWSRFDLAFLTPAEFARQDDAGLRRLLGETAAPPPRPAGPDHDAVARVSRLIFEFLRVLGLSPVCIGRQEWLVAQQGVELLRGMLVELLLEQNGVPRAARGAKRLNGFLGDGQRAELEAQRSVPGKTEKGRRYAGIDPGRHAHAQGVEQAGQHREFAQEARQRRQARDEQGARHKAQAQKSGGSGEGATNQQLFLIIQVEAFGWQQLGVEERCFIVLIRLALFLSGAPAVNHIRNQEQ